MQKYKSKSLPLKKRVEDLLSRMTLKEKIGQLNQKMYGWNAYKKTETGYEITEAFKDEVAFGDGIGALYGLLRADPWTGITFDNGISVKDSAKVSNMLQKYVIENTRLGIPLLFSEECSHGHVALNGSIFPANIGIGSTWNPGLCEEVFSCAAAEIRARGGNLGLVSVLDILQDPRWGRSEECYGEDPFLVSCMASAVTRGLQGNTPEELMRSDKIAAVLKHFCAQGAAVGGHNGKAALIGDRELREIHLPAMRAGVKTGAVGCMAAYNEIDGIYCHANKKLLTGILRDEWGFDGIVMSDGCAVDNLKRISGSNEGAVAMALTAGVDINLWNTSYTSLEDAVMKGKISEELVDRAVYRVLSVKFRLGLMDRPFTDERIAVSVIGKELFQRVNLKAAQESVILLKNDINLLPLKKNIRRIVVLGPNADNIYNQLGDYTPHQCNGSGTTILNGIKSIVSEDTEVIYVKGCGIRDTSKEDFAAAVKAAEGSDVAVLVLGGSSTRNFNNMFQANGAAVITDNLYEMDCGEGIDIAELGLGGVQVEMVKEIAATGTPVVVVLIQGRPYSIPWIAENCNAILCGWYPGQEGGKAIADILFGDINPSGKLSVSIPRSSSQLPVYYNYKETSDYADLPSTPLFPFGFGLSYTIFEYSRLEVPREQIMLDELEKKGAIELSVNVYNSGAIDGAEVVQMYISDLEASVSRRVKELKGFEKVWLASGEIKTVIFRLGKEELGIWNDRMEFVVEPGNVKVMIGTNSQIGLETIVKIL